MSKKIILMCLTLALVICVCLSPLMAADNTYSVDINGVTFNIPDNYHEDEEMAMAEDGSVIGNDLESYPCYYIGKVYTDGNNSISISFIYFIDVFNRIYTIFSINVHFF